MHDSYKKIGYNSLNLNLANFMRLYFIFSYELSK